MSHFASSRDINIEQFLTWLQQALNNREIAIGLWCLTSAPMGQFRSI
jgi:hypothetical protein